MADSVPMRELVQGRKKSAFPALRIVDDIVAQQMTVDACMVIGPPLARAAPERGDWALVKRLTVSFGGRADYGGHGGGTAGPADTSDFVVKGSGNPFLVYLVQALTRITEPVALRLSSNGALRAAGGSPSGYRGSGCRQSRCCGEDDATQSFRVRQVGSAPTARRLDRVGASKAMSFAGVAGLRMKMR